MLKPSRYLVLLIIVLIQGCSSLEQAGELVSGTKPTGEVKGVKLSRLDFKGIDLVFDLQVDNPNPVKITLDHLDYELKLLNRSFLTGEQGMGMSLPANGLSQVKLPVRMEFEKLLSSYKELSKRDELPYQIALGLGFDVPLLGRIRLPVQYQGRLPILKIPDISLNRLDIQRLTLQKADLILEFEVVNPNRFALMLDRLDYQLKLNGIDVGNGALSQSLKVEQGGQGRIRLPLTLNFMQAGRGLYTALLGDSGISYELNGALDASGEIPLLDGFRMPLAKQGKVKLK
jgi:LEA14-like dessication related protein